MDGSRQRDRQGVGYGTASPKLPAVAVTRYGATEVANKRGKETFHLYKTYHAWLRSTSLDGWIHPAFLLLALGRGACCFSLGAEAFAVAYLALYHGFMALGLIQSG